LKGPAIGLALSGGTAKSVTHVGVIKALVEADIPISYVAGTSGGSIVGTMFATGMPISTMETVAKTMSWRKLVSIRLTRMGFISSERIQDFVIETVGNLRFEDLAIPSGVTATNLVTGDRKIFKSGPVALAVRASCSIPQIYLPVEIDGEFYVDGGLAEYLPVETAQELGAEFVIASQLAPVDPSHGTGDASLVPAMSKAALAAGADGLLVEVHPAPEQALCDGRQALRPADFRSLMIELRRLAAACGRRWVAAESSLSRRARDGAPSGSFDDEVIAP
jgi:predicted acylesterase/phospholipase RssA